MENKQTGSFSTVVLQNTKQIHGPRLSKGVRKQLPSHVSSIIRRMSPKQTYTGFIATKDKK